MDTTNVITAPEVAVIAPISYDHMTILGSTLTEIATEKAGIIKPGSVVVSAKQEPEVEKVLREAASKAGCPLYYAKEPALRERSLDGQQFSMDGSEVYTTALLGNYQIQNAALALRAVEELGARGYDIPEVAKQEGIAGTRWFGRFTLIRRDPMVFVDGGHNPQGAAVLRQSLEAYVPGQKITFVLGVLKDKDVDGILEELMPIAKRCMTVAVPSERTMDPEALAGRIRPYGVDAQPYQNLRAAMDGVFKEDVVCICGSLYLLSQVEEEIFSRKKN